MGATRDGFDQITDVQAFFTFVAFSADAAVQGHRGLFMGHSFFLPSADQLNQRSAEDMGEKRAIEVQTIMNERVKGPRGCCP